MLLNEKQKSYYERRTLEAAGAGSHYSLAFNPNRLREWAEMACENLLEIDNPTLIYTGMSGISAATAISFIYGPIPMVYVRKPGEESHGYNCEFTSHFHKHKFIETAVFVDDLVDTGFTLNRILDTDFEIHKLIVLAQFRSGALGQRYEDNDFAKRLDAVDFDMEYDYYWTP
jgi:hypothetical protein